MRGFGLRCSPGLALLLCCRLAFKITVGYEIWFKRRETGRRGDFKRAIGHTSRVSPPATTSKMELGCALRIRTTAYWSVQSLTSTSIIYAASWPGRVCRRTWSVIARRFRGSSWSNCSAENSNPRADGQGGSTPFSGPAHQSSRRSPLTKSKCRSRLKMERVCNRQSAPIQTSLEGIGVPASLS